MEKDDFKVYGYRWVILLAFMGIIALNQLLWITFAAITTDAMHFYEVSDLAIGLLSLIFMFVYIFASFPASWTIVSPSRRISRSARRIRSSSCASLAGGSSTRPAPAPCRSTRPTADLWIRGLDGRPPGLR